MSFRSRFASVALLVTVLAASSASQAQVAVGDTAPEALGSTLDGKEVRTSEHSGKVIILSFWASWCAPCRLELPQLEGMQRVAGQEQLRVVAINTEKRAEFRRAAQVLSELQLSVTHDSSGSIAKAYGVRSIPHLVIIGRDGRVQRVFNGYSEKQVDAIIAQVNAALIGK